MRMMIGDDGDDATDDDEGGDDDDADDVWLRGPGTHFQFVTGFLINQLIFLQMPVQGRMEHGQIRDVLTAQRPGQGQSGQRNGRRV